MIYSTYSIPAGATEEEKAELKQLRDDIQLANDFEKFNDNVRALGLSKKVDGIKLNNSTSVLCQFKKDTFFQLDNYSYYDEPIVLLKSVFTEKSARRNGFCKEFIETLKHYCIKKDYGLIAICNPFSASGFDRLFFDYIDFEYTGQKEQRNKMAKLLKICGFKEMSCIAFGGDFYEMMVRCILNYRHLPPKWFQFNCSYFDDSIPIEDELIEKRIEAIKENVLQNAENFDELGRNTKSCW